MAEGTYEYECMRAELLGIDKPDYDEFMKNQKERQQKEVKEEDEDIENIKEADLETEAMGRVTGKLDELNNILKKTQSKISKMKVSCGSIAGSLKTRLGSFSSQSSIDVEHEEADKTVKANETNINGSNPEATLETPKSSDNSAPTRKSDLAKALDKDLSSLDAMIEKAEQAQYSMAYQTKEMKKFTK
ncbi:unnamed protein product [Psylliodes chrysocephalus]|uniref:Uncharacterized protein n=1 Tax=Psylliodes chrysocephalus TaxID=3402493 RepID=A0A9P0GM26_9CUCU|nr:unnamed protein product [Psylliodes chrysocephala]